MSSVNKVILLGNLGRDPDIRSMQSGKKMASFSIATSKRWKDRQSQEQKESTSWHNIVVFNEGLVDVIEKYVKKGSKIYVEGELITRKYQDKDGNDRYTTEVVLQPYTGVMTMLGVIQAIQIHTMKIHQLTINQMNLSQNLLMILKITMRIFLFNNLY